MSQDRRLEDAIRAGSGEILDRLVGVLPAPLDTLATAYRGSALGVLVSGVLELLRASGVDTSAHVTAPRVEVHIHPPHDTET